MAIFDTLNTTPESERALAIFAGISPESIAAQDAARAAANAPSPMYLGNQAPGIPGYGELPALRSSGGGGESKIDPSLRPYLEMGLRRAEQLFFGQPQPSLFPGQMYVSPSAQTEQALAQQEALATGAQPTLQAAQQAYQASLGQIGQTAAGGFLQGNPYQQAMLQAATRPLTQQFGEQVLPGVASLYSRAGRYGSGSMERALGSATEAYGRALGDVSANIVGQDYARERALQQQAQMGQAALAQAAPSFFQMGFLPSQALAQVGAQREAIAAQPLQEQIQRYQFSQQLPYSQLQSYLSSVYGTPMASSVYPSQPNYQNTTMNTVAGAGLGYLGGQALGSYLGGTPFSLTSPSGYGLAGGAIGGLLGGGFF